MSVSGMLETAFAFDAKRKAEFEKALASLPEEQRKLVAALAEPGSVLLCRPEMAATVRAQYPWADVAETEHMAPGQVVVVNRKRKLP